MALPIDPASAAQLRDAVSSVKESATPSSAGADFGDILQSMVKDVVGHDQKAETAVNDFAKGKQLDLHDTLLAMEKSDVTLKFAMSVRNKLLDAYREVMKMGS